MEQMKRECSCLGDEELEIVQTQTKILKTEGTNSGAEIEKGRCPNLKTTKMNIELDKKEELSKSQLKKLKKKERWEKSKAFRRAKEKERTRQKRIEAKLNNVVLGPSRKELKNTKMATSLCKVSVVIDMSFDDLMDPRSIGKCNKQLLHCYSMNRRAENPMQLYFTSIGGKSLAEMEKHDGYKKWDVHIKSEHFLEVFPPEKVVYLTSESDNEVTQLEADKAYIIGGLVDHNAHKGLCFNIAREKGVNHAQLPIGQFLDMKTRKVLTIDHVFAILLHVSSGASWKEAFLKVLPQRKGAKEKEELSEDSDLVTDNQDTESTSGNSAAKNDSSSSHNIEQAL